MRGVHVVVHWNHSVAGLAPEMFLDAFTSIFVWREFNSSNLPFFKYIFGPQFYQLGVIPKLHSFGKLSHCPL